MQNDPLKSDLSSFERMFRSEYHTCLRLNSIAVDSDDSFGRRRNQIHIFI